jgi:lambda repressor-like predicted transcriptional regulator
MRQESWTWHDVKCELAKSGHTIKSFAATVGVTPQAVAKVKRCRSARLERALAKVIQAEPQDIWPDRYRPRQKSR